MGELVGTVAALWRYPVKSMRGEALAAAELFWTGIDGDRRYAFVRTQNRSHFPWLTGREVPRLVTCRPDYADPRNPGSAVSVAWPGGEIVPLEAPALAAWVGEQAEEAVHLMQVSRGLFDAMPVSVASTATLTAAGLEAERFRFNVIVKSAQFDRAWRSGRLVFEAGAELLVSDEIPRCSMITIDPASGARDPKAMRRVVERFGNRLGVYAATARPGAIRVGDRVRLVR